MAKYEIKVAIHGAKRRRARQVRAWIDQDLQSDLSSEQELELAQGQRAWRGTFDLKNHSSARFAYRVALVAEEGAVWRLSIRRCASSGVRGRLLEDSDVLADSKQWLLGTCDISPKWSQA